MDKSNSAKQGLLDWVRARIPEYNINNFTDDWRSGKAISALAEAVRPGQLNLPSDFSNDPVSDARMGMDSALEHMKIPILVDPEDMVNTADELSNMTYIAQFRDYYNAMMEKLAFPGTTFIKNFSFVIQSRNRADFDKSEGGDTVAIDIQPGNVPAEVHDSGNGQYVVSYSLPGPGSYTIGVKINGGNIKGTPFHQNY